MPRSEAGVALLLALLALTLLTLLGLTLAATTSVELQGATNYRWSRQALYNAESGLEVGRLVLSGLAWDSVLPSARTTGWAAHLPADSAPSAPSPTASRNFERGDCDARGNGVGLGAVLTDFGGAPSPYEDVAEIHGEDLGGAFTLWVRRPLVARPDGTLTDATANDRLILVSEGRAPFPSDAPGGDFVRARSAVWVLEADLARGWGQDVLVEGRRSATPVCQW